jgi:hypothetical protein
VLNCPSVTSAAQPIGPAAILRRGAVVTRPM